MKLFKANDLTTKIERTLTSKDNVIIPNGRARCRNCGSETSIFDITGRVNSYCGNCGIRLFLPPEHL